MDKKAAYSDKIDARMARIDAHIDGLKARMKEGQADARIEIAETMDELEAKRQALRARLKGLVEAGGDTWDEMQEEVEEAFTDMKGGIDRFLSRFKQDRDSDAG